MTLESLCSLRVLNPMCMLGAFPQVNTLCLYPGRLDSNDAFCCLPAPNRQSEISWARDQAHCSELCLQWFPVAAAEGNSWSLSKYNPSGISLTLISLLQSGRAGAPRQTVSPAEPHAAAETGKRRSNAGSGSAFRAQKLLCSNPSSSSPSLHGLFGSI